MLLKVKHRAVYNYSKSISLAPHVLKLRPRCDITQKLIEFSIDVKPEPDNYFDCVDLDGNNARMLFFKQNTDFLEITSHSLVETLRNNPFDFILTDTSLPMLGYRADLLPLFNPYRCSDDVTKPVCDFAKKIAEDAEWQVVPFLTSLTERLHREIDYVIRPTGQPMPSEITLKEQRGACRDTAVLFIDCCRSLGLASRFVSGYVFGALEEDQDYLHAWCEVCLPGAGWRGFDPSNGIATAEKHISVAAAFKPIGAAPIDGSFYGSGTETTLTTDIEVSNP